MVEITPDGRRAKLRPHRAGRVIPDVYVTECCDRRRPGHNSQYGAELLLRGEIVFYVLTLVGGICGSLIRSNGGGSPVRSAREPVRASALCYS
jgi:hypothetical protein